MSEFQDAYQEAMAEYRAKAKHALWLLLPMILFAIGAQYFWPGSAGVLFITLVLAAAGIAANKWKARVWSQLEIKHGLKNG